MDLGWVVIEMEIQMLPAKTTEEVVLLSRWEAANLYEKEFTKIIQKLSMHECSKELKEKSWK